MVCGLDEIFAQKPIIQLIDDGMKPNWGTVYWEWELKSRINLQNHIVPISVPLSVFEDEISRTQILQFWLIFSPATNYIVSQL